MKKSSAGIALAATVGFTALTATPAMAVHLPFENCTEAASVGVYNIPAGTPGYAPDLDRDKDAVGCENADLVYDASLVVPHMEDDAPEDGMGDQIVTMPEGAPDTGIAQEPASNDAAILALGGGFVLAAAVGGTYMVRRRNAQG